MVGILFPLVLYFSGPLDWDGGTRLHQICERFGSENLVSPVASLTHRGLQPKMVPPWRKM